MPRPSLFHRVTKNHQSIVLKLRLHFRIVSQTSKQSVTPAIITLSSYPSYFRHPDLTLGLCRGHIGWLGFVTRFLYA